MAQHINEHSYYRLDIIHKADGYSSDSSDESLLSNNLVLGEVQHDR